MPVVYLMYSIMYNDAAATTERPSAAIARMLATHSRRATLVARGPWPACGPWSMARLWPVAHGPPVARGPWPACGPWPVARCPWPHVGEPLASSKAWHSGAEPPNGEWCAATIDHNYIGHNYINDQWCAATTDRGPASDAGWSRLRRSLGGDETWKKACSSWGMVRWPLAYVRHGLWTTGHGLPATGHNRPQHTGQRL